MQKDISGRTDISHENLTGAYLSDQDLTHCKKMVATKMYDTYLGCTGFNLAAFLGTLHGPGRKFSSTQFRDENGRLIVDLELYTGSNLDRGPGYVTAKAVPDAPIHGAIRYDDGKLYLRGQAKPLTEDQIVSATQVLPKIIKQAVKEKLLPEGHPYYREYPVQEKVELVQFSLT